VFGVGQHVDEGGETGDVGVVGGEPESAFFTVGVGRGAGELTEPVLVGDADFFEVVDNVGGEGEERVGQRRISYERWWDIGRWPTLCPGDVRGVGVVSSLVAGEVYGRDAPYLGVAA
jgi:hypothetical protein